MSERLEYQGNPLPSGLPGFGNPSLTEIALPGISNVVIPTKLGPVVDIPADSISQPPSPTAPTGSDPANPTTEVVNPGPTPQIGGGGYWLLPRRTTNWMPFYVCENGAPKQYFFMTSQIPD
jgi:hypothetical protein